MLRYLPALSLIVTIVAATSAQANSVGDAEFGRGMLAIGEVDRAIPALERALAAGDLPRRWTAVTRFDLGEAHSYKGEEDQGFTEIDAAVHLYPTFPQGYETRGRANFRAGRFSAAADDFAEALRIVEAHPVIQNDLGDDVHLSPRDTIDDVLWLHVARARAGQDDTREFAHNAAPRHADIWPGPLLEFYLGKLAPEQVMELAQAVRFRPSIEMCTAFFYLGEDAASKRDEPRADRRLRNAVRECTLMPLFHYAALADVNRMEKR